MPQYYEITISGDFKHAIEAIANAGVKLTAHLMGDNGNKVVLDDVSMDKILGLGLNIACITPVNVVRFQNRPGGLDAILTRYKNFDIISSYAGADNVMVIKVANSCLYYPDTA